MVWVCVDCVMLYWCLVIVDVVFDVVVCTLLVAGLGLVAVLVFCVMMMCWTCCCFDLVVTYLLDCGWVVCL